MAGGVGNTQLIGGVPYQMYTPAWQSAMQADEAARAGRGGTNAGTAQGNAITAVTPSLTGLLNAANGSSGSGGGSSSSSSASGGLLGASSGGGGSTTGVPSISGGTPIADVKPVDMTAANAATFGAAKDQAGQTGRAEIDSMNGLLGATGMLGSGAQVQGTKDIVEQAGQGANDITRQNATTTAANDLDIAKTNQATQLAERGQNISAQQAQAQLAMEQAQLNSQRQLQILQSVLGVSSGGAPAPSLY